MKETSPTSDEYVQFLLLKETDNQWKYNFPQEQLKDIYRIGALCCGLIYGL